MRSIAGALRSTLRSYDPIVRIGGDEFLCGLTNTALDASRHRVEELQAAVVSGPAGGSIAVGVACLAPNDTLDQLTARADAAMYAHKPQAPEAEAK